MGIEEKLPSGILLTTVEKLAGYMRRGSLWPATFGYHEVFHALTIVGAGLHLAAVGFTVLPKA